MAKKNDYGDAAQIGKTGGANYERDRLPGESMLDFWSRVNQEQHGRTPQDNETNSEESQEEPHTQSPEQEVSDQETSKPKWARNNNKGVTGDYTVKRGDTLSAIAKKHNISLAKLKELNPHIKDANHIYIGDKINLISNKDREEYEDLSKEEWKGREPEPRVKVEDARPSEKLQSRPVIEDLEGEDSEDNRAQKALRGEYGRDERAAAYGSLRRQNRQHRRTENAKAKEDYYAGNIDRDQYKARRRYNREDYRATRKNIREDYKAGRSKWKIDV